MSKTTWADVKKGDAVSLDGRAWLVVKIKRDGKKAEVKVEHKGRTAKSVVKLADKVEKAATGGTVTKPRGGRPGALHTPDGAQNRWATKRELADVLGRGEAAQTKPPAKAKGADWKKPADKVERSLEKNLGARLVGETKNEDAGYYVPPVDVSTVAAHLAIFHGGIPDACDDEAKMLRAHDAQHAAAAKGEGVLAVNHWHTERRP